MTARIPFHSIPRTPPLTTLTQLYLKDKIFNHYVFPFLHGNAYENVLQFEVTIRSTRKVISPALIKPSEEPTMVFTQTNKTFPEDIHSFMKASNPHTIGINKKKYQEKK